MTLSRTRRDWLGLAAWIAVSLTAGAVGGLASRNAAEFYGQLRLPVWAPPSWVFGPVWTTLYVLMGIAAWLVWREDLSNDLTVIAARRRGLALFGAQLVVNALWTWLFFAWRQGALAFADILLLCALIVVLMGLFANVRRRTALLLMPYLTWVIFASALTWWTWRNNPDLL